MKEVEFLQFIIENLVEFKDDIIIEKKEDELWILLILKVNKNDMWVIIWKNGNIVTSIRTILKIVWNKIWKRVNLKVLD